ncbi:MAG: sigma-70 family RNA polymerase sigma factor [Planctomycetaceae bacterium]
MSHLHQQLPELPSVTSTSLLDCIRCQNGEAWERFVVFYCPLIYDVCRRHGVQPADAEDVAQEVLHSVSRAIIDFRKERPGDSFRGWLYRIVQNKVRDHFRRTARRPHSVGGSDFQLSLDQLPAELSDDSILHDSAVDPALTRALEMIRAEFKEQTWSAFWRLTVDGQSAAEVAADLGMKTNAVRQAKFRIMQRLRTEFGDLIDLPN